MADIIFGSMFSRSDVSFHDSDSGVQIFNALNVTKVTVQEIGESTSSPAQITAVIADINDPELTKKELSQAKVVLPGKVTVSAIVLDVDSLSEVIATAKDVSLMIDMVSRSLSISGLVIGSTRITTNAEVINGARITIIMQQVFIPDELNIPDPEQAGDSDSADMGVKPTEPVDIGVGDL